MSDADDQGAIAIDEAKLEHDEERVRRGFWPKIKAVLGRVPFAEDLLAAYYCATDRATPLYVKAILMGALAYFVLPADVVPDMIAMLGFTDDAAVLAAAVRAISGNVKEGHRARARAWLADAANAPVPPAY